MSSSQRIGRISKIRCGSGEGTTRRQFAPSCLKTQLLVGRDPVRLGLVVDGTDELGRILERRVVRVDLDHRQQARERHLDGQQVAQLLLEEIADHALGLAPSMSSGYGLDGVVGGRLQRQQPHLRPVAVRQDQLVLRASGASARAAIRTFCR